MLVRHRMTFALFVNPSSVIPGPALTLVISRVMTRFTSWGLLSRDQIFVEREMSMTRPALRWRCTRAHGVLQTLTA